MYWFKRALEALRNKSRKILKSHHILVHPVHKILKSRCLHSNVSVYMPVQIHDPLCANLFIKKLTDWPNQRDSRIRNARIIVYGNCLYLPAQIALFQLFHAIWQNWGSDVHFEVLKSYLVQKLWNKMQMFPFICDFVKSTSFVQCLLLFFIFFLCFSVNL